MRKRGLPIIILLTMFSQWIYSQSQMDVLHQAGICDDEGYCIPSLQGLPRSKGVSFNHTTIRNQNMQPGLLCAVDPSIRLESFSYVR